MSIYKSYDDLNGKTLQFGDTVQFTYDGVTTLYIVRHFYLENLDSLRNDHIFHLLGIDPFELAKKVYGQPTDKSVFWPRPISLTSLQGREHLTRLVLTVFAIIEGSDWIQFLDGPRAGTVLKLNNLDPFKYGPNIGGYDSRFYKNHFKVGCIQLPYSVLRNVYDFAKKHGFI